MKMYYCKKCNDVSVRDNPPEVKEDICLEILDIDESCGEPIICRGDLKPCTEFITSKEIMDHVSQLQVLNSMLKSSNESLTTEKQAFSDAYGASQNKIKELEKELKRIKKGR